MRKTLSILALAIILLGMGVPSGTKALPSSSTVVEVEPGLTEFEVHGQEFLVICTQPLRIMFNSVSEDRVLGIISTRNGENLSEIKLMWLNHPGTPLTLADGFVQDRSCHFDSDDVTGHNEKLR